jgi:hypothetical protein
MTRDFKVGDEVTLILKPIWFDYLYKVIEILDDKTQSGLTKMRLIPIGKINPYSTYDVGNQLVVNQNQIKLSKNQLREEKLKELGIV